MPQQTALSLSSSTQAQPHKKQKGKKLRMDKWNGLAVLQPENKQPITQALPPIEWIILFNNDKVASIQQQWMFYPLIIYKNLKS